MMNLKENFFVLKRRMRFSIYLLHCNFISIIFFFFFFFCLLQNTQLQSITVLVWNQFFRSNATTDPVSFYPFCMTKGVDFDDILSVVSSTNRMIDWIIRNLVSVEPNVIKIYKTLIGSCREYCTRAWAPALRHGNKSLILRLEDMQRRVTKKKLSKLLIEFVIIADIFSIFLLELGIYNQEISYNLLTIFFLIFWLTE